MLTKLCMLAFASALAIMATTQAQAAEAKPRYGAVAVGIVNQENFDHHWSSVGVTTRHVSRARAAQLALSRCNASARNEDGCMILEITKSTDDNSCRFSMNVSGTYGATFVVATTPTQAWRSCKEIAGALCEPASIKGGCNNI